MKHLKVMTAMTFGLIMTMHFSAGAQNSAKEGLERIKGNLNNSKTNLSEYEKNLKTVDANISEVQKAKAQVESQQKQVIQQGEENNQALGRIGGQEKEIQALINDENGKIAQENQKIQELEAMIAKIKENQKKREVNVSDYQLQMNQLQEEKKIWITRAHSLKDQNEQVTQKLRSIASEENEWKGKQRGYQGEVKRWSKEVERQQKISDSYNSLADVK